MAVNVLIYILQLTHYKIRTNIIVYTFPKFSESCIQTPGLIPMHVSRYEYRLAVTYITCFLVTVDGITGRNVGSCYHGFHSERQIKSCYTSSENYYFTYKFDPSFEQRLRKYIYIYIERERERERELVEMYLDTRDTVVTKKNIFTETAIYK